MPASAFPSNVRQAGPISLRTHGLVNRDARYSYTDTPTDLQRPNFQSASSPVNSMIAESPMPLAGGAIPNHPEQLPTPRFPVEKTVLAGVDSPYSPESLHEVHPALYAPFAEPAKLSGEADITDVRESAKPGSNKTDDQLTSLTYGSTYAPSNTEPTRSLSGTIHGSTFYNPDSLAGTNVALENHRPGQVSHPNAMVDPKWKHSLCEIDSLCCAGLFCPCVVYGKTQYRLSRREQKQDPTDLLSYQSVNGSCGMMAAACGLQWILSAIQRTRLRKLYQIEGSVGDDCLKGLCCCCCVIMQDEREIRDREEHKRRYAGPSSGYGPPPAMSHAPPPR